MRPRLRTFGGGRESFANTRVDWSAPNVLVWPNNIARADGFVRLYNWGGSTEETVKKKKVVYYILWGYCN
jgi:hypothetical protein